VNRRQFLLSSVAGATASAQSNRPVQRPNILVIMADDLGAWMLGCYGNKEIRTPNIDNLARGGLRFTNAFCTTPICSPSRATFFTGRTPSQHGIHDFLDAAPIENPPQGQKEAPASFASEVMISDLLARAGYNCGYVGKWHMGNDRRPSRGYKYTYTMLGGSGPYNDPEMSLDGEIIKEKGYLADLMTQRACEFLDRQSPTAPFFLTVGYLNPHTPYSGHPQKYYDMYANTPFETVGWERPAPNALREKQMLSDIVGNLRKCAASVTALDDQIPVLTRKLQERKLWDNTLIVFTGDNGYLLGRHGLWSKGLASDPPNMYEEVVKVPFILSWPGKIPTAEIAPELISFYDVLPTLCEAAAVAPPTNRNLTGRSFLPIAKRDPLPKNAQSWRNLVFAQLRNTWMARDARYKLVQRNGGQGPNELFDIVNDPGEKANRYDDPRFNNVRMRLMKELEAWRKRIV
jgi:choline-sulfatase